MSNKYKMINHFAEALKFSKEQEQEAVFNELSHINNLQELEELVEKIQSSAQE